MTMVVIALENAPPGLRGELTRWMLEPHPGMFVGSVSAMVRDRLWEQVCRNPKVGGGMVAYTTNNEQGFTFRSFGTTRRSVEDFDGLLLVRVP